MIPKDATIADYIKDSAPSFVKVIVVLMMIREALEERRDRGVPMKMVQWASIVLNKIMDDTGIPEEDRLEMAEQIQREWDMLARLGGL